MKPQKYIVQFLSVFVFICSFICSAFAAPDIELPQEEILSIVAVAPEEPVYLAPYIRYAYNLDAKDAKSALAQKSEFLPYDVLALKKEPGTYWFLISFDKIKDKDAPAAYLDLGNFLPKNSHVLMYSNGTKRWQVAEDVYTKERKNHTENFDVADENNINIFHSGLYDLTPLRDGGELLIYSPGVPTVWFSPKLLSPASAPFTFDRRFTPFILLAIFVLMLFSFWRGAKEEGDARIWAAFLCLAALVQYVWGVPQNVQGKFEYLDMVGIIAASLALFFLPHIGRHLLVTEKKSPHFDSLLQFLAIPAIFPLIVLFVPLPDYYYILRFAPLWGLFGLVLFIFTVPLVLTGRKGAKLYAFVCLAIGLGSLGALAFRYNSEWYFLNYLGLLVAMVAIFLAPRQTEKNIFDEQLSHEDIVSAFAENNSIMRDALYRVELKLREPFDRIMRETCFLDFDLKTEEYMDSLSWLDEKELGDRLEKNSINAIDEVVERTKRLQGHTSSLVLACRDLSGMLGHITELAQKEPVHSQVNELFNVKTLITQACDNIRAEAQDRQVGLGWYIAPSIGLHYRGDKAGLEVVLSLLLRDAIRATEKGVISVRVRRANSPNPGHIVFTISDSGKGRPPVQRSILTLVKAWELSSAYNGEVELRTSPNGLSFSFSMQCLAMDQNGEKPLSYASLDDIVLSHSEASYQKKNSGLSGGNIVFTRGSEQELDDLDEEEAPSFITTKKETSILIISPLAIQRQNIVYYLNRYETWEALDVESALAFYEKKPASLVLVHSALSANGCSAVIAGIRLLEDNLGISHVPCVGLYQSAKDMDFLRLAGCEHTLPDNIGREDLCTAVTEILGDKDIPPITDIEASHAVVKDIDKKVQKAVKKRLKTEVVHAGSVVDGSVSSLEKKNHPQVSEQYGNYGNQAHEDSAKQTGVYDFKEEKHGVFSKFAKALKGTPNVQVKQEEKDMDTLVGEPKPIEPNFVSHAKENTPVQDVVDKEALFIRKISETEQDEQATDSVNQTDELLSFADKAADSSAENAEDKTAGSENISLEINADMPKDAQEADTHVSSEFLSFGEKTEEISSETKEQTEASENKQAEESSLSLTPLHEEKTTEEAQLKEIQAVETAGVQIEKPKITLSFLPSETSYEVEADEDLPPASLRNAFDDVEHVEEITKESVFVQSGLVSLREENLQNKEAHEQNVSDSAQADEHAENSEEQTERTVNVSESIKNRETVSFTEEQSQNSEQEKTAEDTDQVADEAHILELSAEMLVDVKEEKAKKKTNKKKEEKVEKSGLDILLDYSNPKDEDEEAAKSKKEEKIVQLSFFPIDDTDKK